VNDLVGRVFFRTPSLSRTRTLSDDLEKGSLSRARSPASHQDFVVRGDNPSVRFSLYICFLIASLANFGSLVQFSAASGDTGCGASSYLRGAEKLCLNE
jgi:hypothetical protein